MKRLLWRQVNAWRMSQNCLFPRLKRQDFIEAVSRTGGIQSQVMSAAELAVWARVDGLSADDVQSALWRDHTLVKTWAMRGTLHLIAARDYPLHAAASRVQSNRNWLNYFAYYGISPVQYEAFLAAVPHILGSQPMTRQQLAAALDRHLGVPELSSLVMSSSWGSPLKPSAFYGDLCLGPNQGRNATYVNPGQWIGEWQAVEPYPALQEMARRYLRAFGPAAPEDFVRWMWGGRGMTAARKLFTSLAGELEEVDIEGQRLSALRTTLEPMQTLETTGVVRLLPQFDAYAMGLSYNLKPVLPEAYRMRVFRPQGWISAVVLVDGNMQGVWEYKTRRSQTTIKIRMFSAPPGALIKQGIEAEAERLGAYLNSKAVLEYEDP